MCKVSVIIPYYNREDSIERAIYSVINQTYKCYEIILINDGSSDNSKDIVEHIIRKNRNLRIININQENSGVAKARNIGIDVSKGDYIAFLDSDDTWKNEKLEKQITILKENSWISILGTEHDILLNNKVINRSKNKSNIIEAKFEKMLYKNFFTMPTTIIKRSVLLDSNIRFKEEKHRAEDQLFFMEIMKNNRGAKIQLPLVSLYKYEAGVSGLSGNIYLLQKDEIDNFVRLFNMKYINIFQLITAISFALIKFVRRFLICFLSRK